VGKWWSIALAALGCNAIFEENPEFVPDSDSSTSIAASDGTAPAASTSDGGDEAPTQCVGVDMYEPNDSANELAVLEQVTSVDVVAIAAQLEGAADEDWYKQPLAQAGGTQPRPTATVAAPEPVLTCVYVDCTDGDTTVQCGEFTPDTGDNGRSGCCGEDFVSLGYTCAGAVDLDASTYIRLTAAAPIESCIPYDATLEFD
jgi:hypothetical protein